MADQLALPGVEETGLWVWGGRGSNEDTAEKDRGADRTRLGGFEV